jgi:type II secretion system protein G
MKTRIYKHHSGFTLIELLAVIAVIGILTALLLPALKSARLSAKVVKVHGELKSLSEGLEMYFNTFQKYPPARKGCTTNQGDYNAFPQEVVTARYVDFVPEDVFNKGQKYKYTAPGLGWVNGWPQPVVVWVPKDYPDNEGEKNDKNKDVMYSSRAKCPIKWALWSVGPYGGLAFWESDYEHIPVPKRTWYSAGKQKKTEQGTPFGVIVRLSNGRISQ